jgi:dTDP-glucose 4,6-dehydratase
MKFLVTGGRGFIGSHFVEKALQRGDVVVDIDKMGYASSNSLPWDNHPNYTFIKADISEIQHLPSCDVIVNFAAESHVDNSIKSSDVFVKSNIIGVHNLLELVRGKPSYDRPLFFHISTDEVYGDRAEGLFTELDKLAPSNPYSATKAAAEMLVLSYARTYNIDYVITRSSNNYGERQFEEKLIPKCIASIKNNKKIPIHGDGSYIRDWTYVKDNVNGIFTVLDSGIKNDVFNIAAENYMTNLEVAKTILNWFDKNESLIQFVENRWGQDLRYAVSSDKLRNLGWKPQYESGLHNWIK